MGVAAESIAQSQTKLKAWGTSRAVRIPKRICENLGISAESVLLMEEGHDERGPYLTLRPAELQHRSFSEAAYQSLDSLFEGYEGAYRPHEADWGDDVGSEVVA